MRRPNIVFLFTDDQRFDTIHALGNPEIKTPNMDELVYNGCSFTQAHIPGGTCGAVCMPSRAMLHSGRFLFSLEKEGQQIPKGHVTLGQALLNKGYNTYGIGKWHNGMESYNRSFNDGDEIFFGGMWDHWNVPANRYDKTGRYEQSVPFIYDFFHSRDYMDMKSDHIHHGEHSTTIFSAAARRYIEGYQDEKPFFLYVSFMAPHDPRSMPRTFLNMYDIEDISLPENFAPRHNFDFGINRVRDENLADYPRDPEEIKRHILEYYAMISHADFEIGRIIESLKQRNLYDDTIILLAGDNGLALGQHGLMGKQNNYDHSVRVPLVIKGPGIAPDTRSDALVYLMDIYPTLMDMLDLATPDTVEGKSLVPCLADGQDIRDSLYFAYTDLMRSIKTKRYKLIEYATGDLRMTQLFDLIKDPMETNNLFQNRSHDTTVRSLRQRLYEWRDLVNDTSHPLGTRFWSRYTE